MMLSICAESSVRRTINASAIARTAERCPVISAAIDAYLMFGLAEAKALGKALRSSEADFKKAWYIGPKRSRQMMITTAYLSG